MESLSKLEEKVTDFSINFNTKKDDSLLLESQNILDIVQNQNNIFNNMILNIHQYDINQLNDLFYHFLYYFNKYLELLKKSDSIMKIMTPKLNNIIGQKITIQDKLYQINSGLTPHKHLYFMKSYKFIEHKILMEEQTKIEKEKYNELLDKYNTLVDKTKNLESKQKISNTISTNILDSKNNIIANTDIVDIIVSNKTKLIDAQLENIEIVDKDLSNSNLSKSNLTNAKLSNINLSNSNLTNTNLSYSLLDTVDMSHCKLYNTNFSYSNFKHIQFGNISFNNSILNNSIIYNSFINNCLLENIKIIEIDINKNILDSNTLSHLKFTNLNLINNSIINNNFKYLNIDKGVITENNMKKCTILNNNLDSIYINNNDFINCILSKINITKSNIIKLRLLDSNIDLSCWIKNKISYLLIKDTTIINIDSIGNYYYLLNVKNSNLENISMYNDIFNTIEIVSSNIKESDLYLCYYYNSKLSITLDHCIINNVVLNDTELINSNMSNIIGNYLHLENGLLNKVLIDTMNLKNALFIDMNLSVDIKNSTINNSKYEKVLIHNSSFDSINYKKLDILFTKFETITEKNGKYEITNINNSSFKNYNSENSNWDVLLISRCHLEEIYFNKNIFKIINLQNSYVEKTKLVKCILDDSNITINKIYESSIEFMTMYTSIIKNNIIMNSNINKTTIYESKITNNEFIDSNLEDIEIVNSRLKDVYMENCNLSNLDFESSTLENINFNDSRLRGINLCNSSLVTCKLDTIKLIQDSIYNDNTIWNPEFINYQSEKLCFGDILPYKIEYHNKQNPIYYYEDNDIYLIKDNHIYKQNDDSISKAIIEIEDNIVILDLLFYDNLCFYSYEKEGIYYLNKIDLVTKITSQLYQYNQSIKLFSSQHILVIYTKEKVNIYEIVNFQLSLKQEIHFENLYNLKVSVLNKLLVLVNTENEIYIYNSNLGLYNNNNFKFSFVEKIVYLDTNELGYRIDICPNKPIIALSSIDEFNIGCIHIYEYITNKWKRNVSITSKKPLPYDNFGYSISFDNNYLLIGAPRFDNYTIGSIYLYNISTKQLIELYYPNAIKNYLDIKLRLPNVPYKDVVGYKVFNSNNEWIICGKDNSIIYITKHKLDMNIIS